MLRDELNSAAGVIGTVAILAIMIILLAVLALVVVNALAESPWGVFTVAATIPIAMFMGGYLRYLRVGKVLEASAIGVVLLLLAVWGGKFIYASPIGRPFSSLPRRSSRGRSSLTASRRACCRAGCCSRPRDYLSTFMKLGTIIALAAGCFLVLPDLQMPALTKFVDGSGPVVPGNCFRFASSPSRVARSAASIRSSPAASRRRSSRAKLRAPIGYGAMCLESLVAIMAMIAACTLEPGVYLSMNVKVPAADVATATVAQVNGYGAPFTVTVERMTTLAETVQEKTLFGRTGGAARCCRHGAHLRRRVWQRIACRLVSLRADVRGIVHS
jgi:carbon starvation protein